jgi:hypothetical protein
VTFGTQDPGGDVDPIPAKVARFDLVYGVPVYLGRKPWPRRQEGRVAHHEAAAE